MKEFPCDEEENLQNLIFHRIHNQMDDVLESIN